MAFGIPFYLLPFVGVGTVLIIALIMLILSMAVAVTAKLYGRRSFEWMIVSLVLSPIIAGPALVFMRDFKQEREEERHLELMEALRK